MTTRATANALALASLDDTLRLIDSVATTGATSVWVEVPSSVATGLVSRSFTVTPAPFSTVFRYYVDWS
jgi:hypothetical protein